jgi:hypothetical protein
MKKVALFILALWLAGCGYSMTRLLPANYRTIHVASLKNEVSITEEVSEYFGYQTYLPELEEKVTRGVINRFLFDGNLRVTPKKEEADLVLEGKITSFFRQGIRRLDDNTVEEYRLNLVGALTLRDRQGKLVWEEPNFVGDTTYFVTGASAKAESAAVDDLITDFSRRVVERVVENW